MRSYSRAGEVAPAATFKTVISPWLFVLAMFSLVPAAQGAAASILEGDNPIVPDYVTKYAPLVWLHSEDPFLPSDLQKHLDHTTPKLKGKPVIDRPELDLDNLEILNRLAGKDVALTSNDDITDDPMPDWLYGEKPDAEGRLHNATASAVIVIEKESDIVDAFYFYFYSYDQGGNMTLVKEPFRSFIGPQDGMHIGSHVGDWEHSMIRFQDGKPTGIYYSQHSGGAAYDWDDDHLTFKDGRPYVFSALGSHANYPTSGVNTHDAALLDLCDKGKLWDPTLPAYFYHLDAKSFDLTRLSPSESDIVTTNFTSWFYFEGRWGDTEYAADDDRQHKVPWVGLKRFVTGPNGPQFKGLLRKGVLPDDHGGKNLLQFAAGTFMAIYPYFLEGWRKWVTILVAIMVVASSVLTGKFVARRYWPRADKGYRKVYEDIPLEDSYRESNRSSISLKEEDAERDAERGR